MTSKSVILKRMMKIFGLLLLILLVVEGVRLYQLYGQRAEYREYWSNRAQESVPANALTYVALGDSTAQGIGANKPEKGYVGLLAERLAEKTGRPVHVINLSVTGARVADVINGQIPQLQQLDLPEDAVVTLGIGSNNIRSFGAEDFRQNFGELAAMLPKQTVVADIPYFGGGRANSGEKSALEASQIIRSVAESYGLPVAPLHKITKDNDSIRNYAADFFHPSDRAYKLWADAFWQILGGKQL